jgi:uncharacterized protein (DUF1778 family)
MPTPSIEPRFDAIDEVTERRHATLGQSRLDGILLHACRVALHARRDILARARILDLDGRANRLFLEIREQPADGAIDGITQPSGLRLLCPRVGGQSLRHIAQEPEVPLVRRNAQRD